MILRRSRPRLAEGGFYGEWNEGNEMTLERAVAAFANSYDDSPDWVVRAPGRVNLIGEHTDYNDGFVMPIAIDRAVFIAGRNTGEDSLRRF